MKNLYLFAGVVIAAIFAAIFLGGGGAHAHNPYPVATTSCDAVSDTTWTVSVTVTAGSDDTSLTWKLETPVVLDVGPITASASFDMDVPIDDQAVDVTVRAAYYRDGELVKKSTRTSNLVERPSFPCGGTTTTIAPPTTTIAPPPTTVPPTTVPPTTTVCSNICGPATVPTTTTTTTPPPSSTPSSSTPATTPPRLPDTGNGTILALVASALLALGAVAVAFTRRRPS